MPYTGNPIVGSTDEVRLLIGDTDTDNEQLSDAELQYFITTRGPGLPAAIMACVSLMAKYARKTDVTVGDVSAAAGALADHYAALAAKLESKIFGLPSMGGVDAAAVQAAKEDDSQVQPAFTRSEFDNPRAASKTDPFDNGSGPL